MLYDGGFQIPQSVRARCVWLSQLSAAEHDPAPSGPQVQPVWRQCRGPSHGGPAPAHAPQEATFLDFFNDGARC